MEPVFKALADPTRRKLLDALRHRDGQTLTELEATLEMSRFGVMKHLKVLENATLIVTRKSGRFKHHYLNAAPLQDLMDRWVAPFLQPHARALIDLKTRLEKENTMTKPDFTMQTRIRCTQDALWTALTDADAMTTWHFMAERVTLEDDTFHYIGKDGTAFLMATKIDATPKTRIVATFEPQRPGGGTPSRNEFIIQPDGDTCVLTVEHYDLDFPVMPGEGVDAGWRDFASSLKTYLETGTPMKPAT